MMDKPTPPKVMTETDSAPGWPAGTRGCVLITDAQIEAYGEAMAAWGAAQYKEDAEKSLATIAACKDRFQRILDEPNNTMSDSKAMREVMRQANLGLSACAAIDKARGK